MSASERPLRMRQRTSSVIGSPLLLDLVLSESTIALQPRVAALTRRHSFHHGQRPNLSTLERARAATMSALPFSLQKLIEVTDLWANRGDSLSSTRYFLLQSDDRGGSLIECRASVKRLCRMCPSSTFQRQSL